MKLADPPTHPFPTPTPSSTPGVGRPKREVQGNEGGNEETRQWRDRGDNLILAVTWYQPDLPATTNRFPQSHL